jgi:hypothetical protein
MGELFGKPDNGVCVVTIGWRMAHEQGQLDHKSHAIAVNWLRLPSIDQSSVPDPWFRPKFGKRQHSRTPLFSRRS